LIETRDLAIKRFGGREWFALSAAKIAILPETAKILTAFFSDEG
jgi:hypothetical protein